MSSTRRAVHVAASLISTIGLAFVVAGAGCGAGNEPEEIVDQTSSAVAASAVSLTLAPRVLPGGTTPVNATTTVTGLPGSQGVLLRFTGDRTMWPNADIPGVASGGGVFKFTKALEAPLRVGQHRMSWQLQTTKGTPIGAPIARNLEVTCSDGLFCNGEERFTKLGCVAGRPPCDDGVACTTDHCDEARGTCTYEPNGPSCATCASKQCNPKCQNNAQCGDDGCGGKCVTPYTDAAGTCLGGNSCVGGVCQAVSLPGTCGNPLPLFGAAGTQVPAAGIVTTVQGDTGAGIDAIKVSCGGDGIKELVYRFDVPTNMGVDIRALSADGDPNGIDTVVAIHQADCLTQGPWPGFCSDDASPPGGLGSRVYGPLDAGSYRLVVTGYSASQVGPVQLQIKFVPGCVPTCDGKYCGPDGCGGTCGACQGGQLCSAAGRCFTAPCAPNCNGKKCGDDGCGGSCGTCAASDICVEAEGKCVAKDTCDHLLPVCKSCPPKTYCGSDCQCHKVEETMVDLVPAPAATLLPSIEFEWRTFDSASCSLNEGCVPAAGRWLLMRFTTDVLNQGLVGFKPGNPTQHPDYFRYDDCHQHYHFQGFANYGLYSFDGAVALAGRKQSYCMEDSYQHLLGPNIPCAAQSTCDDQGIQPGWADSYPNTLDCQWLVLRGATATPYDLPLNKWYLHETCTNTQRLFPEHSFENNCIRVPVYVPDVPDNGQVVKYSQLTLPPMP